MRKETSMRFSAKQYRQILESWPDAVYILDLAGRITFANSMLERLTGYARNELLGQHPGVLYPPLAVPPPPDRRRRALPRAVATPRLGTEMIRKDGTRIPVESLTTSLIADGEKAGDIVVVRDKPEREQAAAVLREREEQIRQLAYYDPLTGLPNRTLFQDTLQRAIQAGQQAHLPVAVLLLGLDRFQEIKTTLGYHHGDLLLQQVGQRLRHVVLPDAAQLARLDADTFAVVMQSGVERAMRGAQLLLEELAPPFMIEQLSLDVAVSVGIACFPEHGTDAMTLVRHADVASWAARQAGIGCTIYSAAQDHFRPERLARIAEIRQALEQGQLTLHYQPLVRLSDERISGVEALIRWDHPQRGQIPPTEFIPVAEHAGLIRPMTLWTLEAALRQCSVWLKAGLDLTMSVNLSVRNLYDTQLADQIARVLDTVGIASSRLMLEITESFVMADPPRALTILTRLWAMGVRLAIDDFGTGYSSLGYLKRLPVHVIKVDKTFVRGLMRDRHDAAIVRAAVDLGHHLGLAVIAEGVEDQQTWHGLVALGCDEVQGHYISPPQPADELFRWLSEIRDINMTGNARDIRLGLPSWRGDNEEIAVELTRYIH